MRNRFSTVWVVKALLPTAPPNWFDRLPKITKKVNLGVHTVLPNDRPELFVRLTPEVIRYSPSHIMLMLFFLGDQLWFHFFLFRRYCHVDCALCTLVFLQNSQGNVNDVITLSYSYIRGLWWSVSNKQTHSSHGSLRCSNEVRSFNDFKLKLKCDSHTDVTEQTFFIETNGFSFSFF